jgi:hypothetical protein
MPAYEVLSASIPPEVPDELWGSFIDTPKPGATGDVFVLHIVGWVLGRRSPATAVEVVYRPEPDQARPHGENVIRVTPIRGHRTDVAAAYPQVPADIDCHFESLVGVIGLTPEFELRLKAVLEDGTRVPIGSLRVRHQPLRTSFQPRLQPITVSCLGRTGTTLLMKMLAAHPGVVVYRRFPYELSNAKYWMQMLKVLAEPSNLIQSTHPDTFHGNLWWVGQNPFYDDGIAANPAHNDWFGRKYIERLATFCQKSIDDWYVTLARSQGQDDAVFFAEKQLWPNYIPVLLNELYPEAKEVFLVRDFRDMTVSMLAFDEKRGFYGFGRADGETEEEFIEGMLKPAALAMCNSWRTRGSRSHLIRYEDMVRQPKETLTGLLDYLELDSTPDTVDEILRQALEETSQVGHHRTSSDAGDSIGRWRHERDEQFRALCQEAFADALAEFGYIEPGEWEREREQR